jgi:hypothetical protein
VFLNTRRIGDGLLAMKEKMVVMKDLVKWSPPGAYDRRTTHYNSAGSPRLIKSTSRELLTIESQTVISRKPRFLLIVSRSYDDIDSAIKTRGHRADFEMHNVRSERVQARVPKREELAHVIQKATTIPKTILNSSKQSRAPLIWGFRWIEKAGMRVGMKWGGVWREKSSRCWDWFHSYTCTSCMWALCERSRRACRESSRAYMGHAIDRMPIPIPPTKRPISRRAKSSAQVWMIDPRMKNIEPLKMTVSSNGDWWKSVNVGIYVSHCQA